MAPEISQNTQREKIRKPGFLEFDLFNNVNVAETPLKTLQSSKAGSVQLCHSDFSARNLGSKGCMCQLKPMETLHINDTTIENILGFCFVHQIRHLILEQGDTSLSTHLFRPILLHPKQTFPSSQIQRLLRQKCKSRPSGTT